MAALNDNALWQFKWDLYIRPIAGWVWTDLWAVRWLISNIDWTNITEILSDNRWTLKKFTNLISNITVTCLEPQDRDKISLLFTSTNTNVPGTPVVVTWEVIQAWAVVVPAGTVYVIKNKSGDNSVVTAVTVDDNGTPLVLDTNYTLKVDTDGSVTGKIWNSYITFLTATSWAWETNVDYTYTPNQAKKSVLNLDTTELKNFEVKIEAYSNTKMRRITTSSMTLNSNYGIWFTDVSENGDVIGAELTFESNKWATYEYYDEIL